MTLLCLRRTSGELQGSLRHRMKRLFYSMPSIGGIVLTMIKRFNQSEDRLISKTASVESNNEHNKSETSNIRFSRQIIPARGNLDPVQVAESFLHDVYHMEPGGDPRDCHLKHYNGTYWEYTGRQYVSMLRFARIQSGRNLCHT